MLFVTKNTNSRASSVTLHTSKVDRLTRRVGSLSKDDSCKDTIYIYILKSKRDKYRATHAARIWVNFLDALATKQLREKRLEFSTKTETCNQGNSGVECFKCPRCTPKTRSNYSETLERE